VYVKESSAVTSDSPASVKTCTSTPPGACGGTTTTIWLAETLLTCALAVPK
jgi:hypothetical protein